MNYSDINLEGFSFEGLNKELGLDEVEREAEADAEILEGMSQEEKIQYQINKAERKELEGYYKRNCVAMYFDEFEDSIKKLANTPPIKTGFSGLDKALGGGLYEGLYVLGAISSLGKTTFTLQIADQIAEQGNDVLIFSLEMARTELMAKSISRNTYIYCLDNGIKSEKAKTTRGITDYSRWAKYDTLERKVIEEAKEAYKGYADGVFIHEGIGNIDTEFIRDAIDEHISITKNKPIVFIDYLQLLAPSDPRMSDKQNTDRNVLELKRISRDYKIPVFAISSFNRESYKREGNGKVNVSDFKESG